MVAAVDVKRHGFERSESQLFEPLNFAKVLLPAASDESAVHTMDSFSVSGSGVMTASHSDQRPARHASKDTQQKNALRPTTAPTPPRVPNSGCKVRHRVDRLKNLNVDMVTCPDPIRKGGDATGALSIKSTHTGPVEIQGAKKHLPPIQRASSSDCSELRLVQHPPSVPEGGKASLVSPFGQPLRALRETWSVQNKPKPPLANGGGKKIRRRQKKVKETASDAALETPKAIAALESFHSQIKSAQTVLDKFASFMKGPQHEVAHDEDIVGQDSAKIPLTSPIIRGALVLNRRHVLKISSFIELKKGAVCNDSDHAPEQLGSSSDVKEKIGLQSNDVGSDNTIGHSETQQGLRGEETVNDDDDEQDWVDIETEGVPDQSNTKVVTSGLLAKRVRRKSWMRSANMRSSSEALKMQTCPENTTDNRAWLKSEHMRSSTDSMSGRAGSRRTSISSHRSWLQADHMRKSSESLKSGSGGLTPTNRRSWINSGHMKLSSESILDRRSWLQNGAMRSSAQSIGDKTPRTPMLTPTNAMKSCKGSRVSGSRFTVVIAPDNSDENVTNRPITPEDLTDRPLTPEIAGLALEEERKREQILARRAEQVSRRRGSILFTELKKEIRQELWKDFPSKPPPLGMMHLYFSQARHDCTEKFRVGL